MSRTLYLQGFLTCSWQTLFWTPINYPFAYALIEKTAYPQFTSEVLVAPALQAEFYPTDEEIRFVCHHARSKRGHLTLLVLLKVHQFLGQTIPVYQIPMPIIDYLLIRLGLSEHTSPLRENAANEKQFFRYRQSIRQFLQIQPWSSDAEQVVRQTVQKAAETMSAPSDLINVALETLSDNHYELPAFSRLDRLVKQIRQQVHRKIYQRTADLLSTEQRQVLEYV